MSTDSLEVSGTHHLRFEISEQALGLSTDDHVRIAIRLTTAE